jgi:phosphatidylglycerol:prolipoprotein diacylglycerol transferase
MLLQVNRVAFNLFGSLPIYWYAIIIVTGVIIGIWLASREAVRVGFKSDDITDYMMWTLPLAIVGARLYYVIFELDVYLANPLAIFDTRQGGLAFYGGLIMAIIVLIVFTRHRFINPWQFLDTMAPSVILAQAIGRWGNFMNHEAYGGNTTRAFLEKLHLPNFIIDNMYIEGQFHHPTFLYESSWNVVGFIVLILLRKKNHFLKRGEVFFGYLIWYGFGRFFIEGMRTDSLYLVGDLRVSQALSAVLFFGSIIWVVVKRKTDPHLPYYDRSHGKNQALL